MTKKRRGALLTTLMFIICIVFNYNPQLVFKSSYLHWGWNFSLAASIFIVLLMKIRNPYDWKQQLGIDFNLKDILGFLISTLILLILSYYLVGYVSQQSGYVFKPQIFNFRNYYSSNFPFAAVLSNYLYFIPETFNEEMLIGAVLLFGLENRFKSTSKVFIAIVVALIFSLMHQVLYKFSPAQPGITLTSTTLFTLFFIGILRNALILKTRKIVYSWSIHLSFNLIFFPGFFIHKATGNFAFEPEQFNITFGNWPMFFLTFLLALLSVLWLLKSSNKNLSFS